VKKSENKERKRETNTNVVSVCFEKMTTKKEYFHYFDKVEAKERKFLYCLYFLEKKTKENKTKQGKRETITNEVSDCFEKW
jgi:hypothetical protein